MKLIATVSLLFLFLSAKTQDFPFGKTSLSDFSPGTFDNKAVVLKEFGRSTIEFNSIKGELVLRKYYHLTIFL